EVSLFGFGYTTGKSGTPDEYEVVDGKLGETLQPVVLLSFLWGADSGTKYTFALPPSTAEDIARALAEVAGRARERHWE
ncbi:MAG: hypothetical protein ACR2HQ_10850, partial [Ilumatobacteraceae bacterium]